MVTPGTTRPAVESAEQIAPRTQLDGDELADAADGSCAGRFADLTEIGAAPKWLTVSGGRLVFGAEDGVWTVPRPQ